MVVATTRIAHTVWEGDLPSGRGTVAFDSSGIGDQEVSWPARADEPNGVTSPEDLIAAAHCSCFAMARSNGLANAGHAPARLRTEARVTFQPGTGITGIDLSVQGEVPGIDADAFRRRGCQGQLPRQPGPCRHHHHADRHPGLMRLRFELRPRGA
jgi:osmotically inducible protein OsmC